MVHLQSIKGTKDFKLIYNTGKRFRSDYVGAIIIFNNQLNNKKSINTNDTADNEYTLKYAVIVGKRNVSKAVMRNRLKRLLRESIRILSKEFDSLMLRIDKIILSYNTALVHSRQIKLQEIMPAVEDILKQAFFYYETKSTKKDISSTAVNSNISDKPL